MKCVKCDNEIPQGRLDIFPDTWYCSGCTAEEPYYGINVFDHKTGGRLVYVRREAAQAVETLQRFNKRARR
jgi:hypothetical protein